MKRILKWLETKFSQHSAAVEADETHSPIGVRPKENAKEENNENAKEENNDSDHTPILATLTILEEPPFVVFESTGFDPYNSGSFDTSKTWESHSRYKRAF